MFLTKVLAFGLLLLSSGLWAEENFRGSHYLVRAALGTATGISERSVTHYADDDPNFYGKYRESSWEVGLEWKRYHTERFSTEMGIVYQDKSTVYSNPSQSLYLPGSDQERYIILPFTFNVHHKMGFARPGIFWGGSLGGYSRYASSRSWWEQEPHAREVHIAVEPLCFGLNIDLLFPPQIISANFCLKPMSNGYGSDILWPMYFSLGVGW
jgi:hypothetical protein